MKQIGDILEQTKNLKRPKNISREFQQYGIYLAEELGDTPRYALYIKLAKNTPRAILEEALSFVKGYSSAKSKAKLFMWKLKQLNNRNR